MWAILLILFSVQIGIASNIFIKAHNNYNNVTVKWQEIEMSAIFDRISPTDLCLQPVISKPNNKLSQSRGHCRYALSRNNRSCCVFPLVHHLIVHLMQCILVNNLHGIPALNHFWGVTVYSRN